jgi:transcriptional regulator with XRE-family HTH domain
VSPGELLRDARKRHGISQQSLARRAGTTQSAISRIERGGVSPSVRTLADLMHLVGENLVLALEPTESGVDRSLIRANLALSPQERFDRGMAFSEFVRRNRGGAVGNG